MKGPLLKMALDSSWARAQILGKSGNTSTAHFLTIIANCRFFIDEEVEILIIEVLEDSNLQYQAAIVRRHAANEQWQPAVSAKPDGNVEQAIHNLLLISCRRVRERFVDIGRDLPLRF